MRERMKEYRLPSVEPFTAVVLDVLNLVFGWGFETAMFWRNTSGVVPSPPSVASAVPIIPIKAAIMGKFARALSALELKVVVVFPSFFLLTRKNEPHSVLGANGPARRRRRGLCGGHAPCATQHISLCLGCGGAVPLQGPQRHD